MESTRFPDVALGHYAFEAVEWAAEVGVTTGYTDGTFKPERPLIKRHAVLFMERYYDEILQAEESQHFIRADMMVLLKSINDGTIRDTGSGSSPGQGASQRFPDVAPGHYAFEAVEWAAEVGVTTGYTDGTFKPERPLIKRHAVLFMERYYDEILQAEESPDFTRGDMMVLLKSINDGTADPIGSTTAALPGEGVDVTAGRANWSSGYFQAELYKQLLEELGYNVSDPAGMEFGPDLGYIAMAQSEMDYWPNGWYPLHSAWLADKLPDGSLVGDHVTIVGEETLAGGLQGFLVTKSFADEYGVYTMDELNSNAGALAAFDATDSNPGNGVADIFGCSEGWTCDDIIENQIAFSGWDNLAQTRAGYDAMFAQAVDDVGDGVPMVMFTWTPSRYITGLRPGDNVYWMGVDEILDDSNPTDHPGGERHDQRGADGRGGYAPIGPDQCPSAADQQDGRCKIGWLAHDIQVTANNDFLAANPAAEALFEAVRLPMIDLSLANVAHGEGASPTDLAAQWIADNRDLADEWIAAALPGWSWIPMQFRSVSVGDGHSCGVRTDRTVACWGDNDYGQATAPTGTFTAVSAGYRHSCGVRTDRTVECWGSNWSEQATPPPPTGTFMAVSAGDGHSCGVRTDRTVACWGRNANGQATAPTGTFTAVSAGYRHSCGVRTDRTVECWGSNWSGQATAPTGTFTAVSAGYWHSCGLRTDGAAECWGIASQALTPSGSFVSVSAGAETSCGVSTGRAVVCWGGQDTLEQATPASGSFASVSVGNLHACATRTDGTVECWGYYGELQTSAPAGAFTSASAGSAHSCGVKTDRTVECWGENRSGQASPPSGAFSSVSAGSAHSCGVRTDRTVECWGVDWDGRATPPTGSFSSVSAGYAHSCGVRTGGTVACWGDDGYRQASPPSVPFTDVSTGLFSSVSAGHAHSCGLRTDRTVECWGTDGNGQGRATSPSGLFTAVSASRYHSCGVKTDRTVECWDWGTPPSGSFSSVSAGYSHSCGLRTDGTIECWGSDEWRQTAAPSGSFTSISAGYVHSCGVKTDRTVECWGADGRYRETPPMRLSRLPPP